MGEKKEIEKNRKKKEKLFCEGGIKRVVLL